MITANLFPPFLPVSYLPSVAMQSTPFEEFCWEKQVIEDHKIIGDHQNCL